MLYRKQPANESNSKRFKFDPPYYAEKARSGQYHLFNVSANELCLILFYTLCRMSLQCFSNLFFLHCCHFASLVIIFQMQNANFSFFFLPVRSLTPLGGQLLPFLVVNLHPSWQSSFTPPGGQPPHLLVVSLHLPWRSTSTPPGGQPPPPLAVNLHPSWRSTSIPPGGQPPSLLSVNLHPSWRSTFTPPTC